VAFCLLVAKEVSSPDAREDLAYRRWTEAQSHNKIAVKLQLAELLSELL